MAHTLYIFNGEFCHFLLYLDYITYNVNYYFLALMLKAINILFIYIIQEMKLLMLLNLILIK